MKTAILKIALSAACALPLGACLGDNNSRPGYYGNSGYREPAYGDRRGPRRLGDGDRVYRGRDGRYYCKRDDGTEGTIVGGLAGGVLGNLIAPGGSKTIGTLLGAGAGALAGRAIDRNNIECR